MTKKKLLRKKNLTASSLLAMSDAQKDRFLREFEKQSPEQRLAESRPLTAKERSDWNAFRKQAIKQSRAGRPKIGEGSAVISLSVERTFLRRVDDYAKSHGLKRSELFLTSVREKIAG